MEIDDLKLATYIDEVIDFSTNDHISAMNALKRHNIHYVSIRKWDNVEILNLEDNKHKLIKTLLSDNGISVINFETSINSNSPNYISSCRRAMTLANYYTAATISIDMVNDNNWLSDMNNLSRIHNLKPIFRLSHGLLSGQLSDINEIVKNYNFQLIYDPAFITSITNIDHVSKYWTLFKKDVAAIDLCDFKRNVGFKPVTFGDSNIKLIVSDAINNNYNGWFFIKPSLGKRVGDATTKCSVFDKAMEAVNLLFSTI